MAGKRERSPSSESTTPAKKKLRSSSQSSPKPSPMSSPSTASDPEVGFPPLTRAAGQAPKQPKWKTLPAKGLQKTNDADCLEPRILWSPSIFSLPQGLPNIRGTCYKNGAHQLLLAIPAFAQWLEKYHDLMCSIDHCVGCAMHRLYRLIYPRSIRDMQISTKQRLNILEEVEALLGDGDGFFQAQNLTLGTERDFWPIVCAGGKEGGHVNEYLQFLCEATMKRNTPAAQEEFESIFTMKFLSESWAKCPADSAHDLHRILQESYVYIRLQVADESPEVNVPEALDFWASRAAWPTKAECLEPTCTAEIDMTHSPYEILVGPTPEAIFISLYWNFEDTDDQLRVKGHLEFEECLDLTKFLSPHRQAQGEKSLYVLNGVELRKSYPLERAAHAAAAVKDPRGQWTFLDDNHEWIRKESLAELLDDPELAPYHPEMLAYVKADGDTTFQWPWKRHVPRKPKSAVHHSWQA